MCWVSPWAALLQTIWEQEPLPLSGDHKDNSIICQGRFRGWRRPGFLIHEGPRRTPFTPFCPRRAAKGHEGPQRTATATPFCPRRAAKGHEGPRRTATATPFCPRRAAKGHEGPRRTATATPFCPRRAAKGHEGPRRKPFTPFFHEGQRRTPFTPFYQRRGAKDRFCSSQFSVEAKCKKVMKRRASFL